MQTSHLCITKQEGQINYPKIMKIMDQYSFTGRLWDPVAKSPFFGATVRISYCLHSIFSVDLFIRLSIRLSFSWCSHVVFHLSSVCLLHPCTRKHSFRRKFCHSSNCINCRDHSFCVMLQIALYFSGSHFRSHIPDLVRRSTKLVYKVPARA